MRLDVFQLEIGSLVAEDDSAGGDGHVVEGVLPVVTEPGGLDGCHLQTDLQTVDDQSGQSLAVHILANDDQGLLHLHFKHMMTYETQTYLPELVISFGSEIGTIFSMVCLLPCQTGITMFIIQYHSNIL